MRNPFRRARLDLKVPAQEVVDAALVRTVHTHIELACGHFTLLEGEYTPDELRGKHFGCYECWFLSTHPAPLPRSR